MGQNLVEEFKIKNLKAFTSFRLCLPFLPFLRSSDIRRISLKHVSVNALAVLEPKTEGIKITE